MGFLVYGVTVMHFLSDAQSKELLKNPNVSKITPHQVIYSAEFKIKAVEQYLSGKRPEDIFLENGISPQFFENQYCRLCIKRWKKKYFEEGKNSLKIETRGSGSSGRPKKENNDKLTYDELKTLVEIQQEVIEGLKKMKALARKK